MNEFTCDTGLPQSNLDVKNLRPLAGFFHRSSDAPVFESAPEFPQSPLLDLANTTGLHSQVTGNFFIRPQWMIDLMIHKNS